MKAIVTGCCGFIGSHLTERLLEEGHTVIGIDNLVTGKCLLSDKVKNNPKFTINYRDIREKTIYELFKKVDVVFHLAALKSVQESMEKPELYHDVNVGGTINLLDYSRVFKVKNFIFSSSSAVYGDTKHLPLETTHFCNPLSPYGKNKFEGEIYVTGYSVATRLKAKCLRYFNVFGPKQSLDDSYSAVIPIFINKALNNEPLVIYGDGTQTRDFIYVKDVVNANLMALKEKHEIYNVGTGNPISITHLALTIKELTNSKSTIMFADKRPGDIMYSYPSKEVLPLIHNDFESGLIETINYFKGLK